MFVVYQYSSKTGVAEAMRICKCLHKNMFRANIDDFQKPVREIKNFYIQVTILLNTIKTRVAKANPGG